MKTKTISAIVATASVAALTTVFGYDPHFFQPLLPGFQNGINIPEAFMMRYLNEELKKRSRDVPVIIRKHNREWVIHLRGRRLEKGWPEFVDSYYSFPDSGDKKKMDVGDIVIFKHKGNLVFEVSVYDANTSLEKLPYHHPNKHNNQSINKKRKKNEMMKNPEEFENNQKKRKSMTAAESKSNILSPVYEVNITLRNMKRNMQYLPRKLVSENGLERNCNMKLDYEKGRSCVVEAKFYPSKSYSYITKGWTDFQTKNHLKPEDRIKFQLIKNGQIPHFRVTKVQKKNDHKELMITQKKKKIEADKKRKRVYPYFDTFIRLSNLEKKKLYVPIGFVRENGLERHFKMIVKNERGRKWEADARFSAGKSYFYITKEGWDSFLIVNGLKIGDCLRKLVDDDEDEEGKVNVN
ncbi:B3 domain-containing protein REM10-like [Impatiens glandulifera]|uniref:B3 domain-containing protein REM10-like n=1 Tax=Impatiens glandulifera TaxID=253017 RepID=UPI001FB1114B|nr:B3 domain-containing protein REM10-like [Impatiens glandulifera]